MSEENLETQVDEQHEEVAESSVDNHGYEKDDIRSVIAAEMDKHEAAEAEKTDDVSKKDEKVNTSEKRDEKGRFTKHEEAQEPVEAEAEQQPIEQESKPARNPWASWKKEAQTALSSLPPETQRYIQEREEQFHKGIEQYKQDAFRGRSLGKALAPHMEYLEQVGVQPEQAIATLIQTEKVLRTADPQTRAQMFMKLAHDYGVDVNSLTNVPFDPYKYQMEQQLAAQHAELQRIVQSQQIAEEAQLGQTIEQFAQQHEYFDEVRETMADLLDKGLASDLNDAYSKAIRLNDDVFTRTTQNNVQANPVQRANNAAKAAKAAAVSVKGAPNGSTRPPEPKSTEEAVRLAMQQLGL
jgi:hypothetical protein